MPQPLLSFLFGACCRNPACGRRHTTGRVVGAEGQSWFSRALQKLGLRLGGIWLSWVMLAFPVDVAMGSQVSCCFVAGFLCDFFFLKWKLFLSCRKPEALGFCLYELSGGSPTRNTCPCLFLLPVVTQHSCQVAPLGAITHSVPWYSLKGRRLLMMCDSLGDRSFPLPS